MGKTAGDKDSEHFGSAAAFQKSLFWYNGAMELDGVMALPPLMSATQILAHGITPMHSAAASLRAVFGGTPNAGVAQRVSVGNVSAAIPTLYVCGTEDDAILCDRPFSHATARYVDGNYTFLAVACGHDLLSCGALKQKVTQEVMDAVVAHLQAAASLQK